MSATAGDKSKRVKKGEYFDKLLGLLSEYPRILIVTCDNIGSHHMQIIRQKLRGKAVILMGKNTMMRRCIRKNIEQNPLWDNLLPKIYGNIGLIFTKGDLREVRDVCQGVRVPASAKAGMFAQKDVIIPKGMTTLEPTKTGFLQALNIGSKINKGNIEILNDVHLIKKGERVGSSEATFLQMLDIKPFEYGLNVTSVYDDGFVIGVEIIDITDDQILGKFASGVANVASLSLGIGLPTIAAFPHVVLNAFKNCVSVALTTDFMFDQAKKLKDIVENPDAFRPVSTTTTTTTTATTAAVVAAPEPDEEPEDEPADFSLFD